MPTLSDVQRFSEELSNRRRGGCFESLLAYYLNVAVTAEPMEKIRLICEAAMLTKLSEQHRPTITRLHKLAVSLRVTKIREDFIAVPWAFAETEQNYQYYLTPWLNPQPTFQWTNEAVRQEQEAKLKGKEVWQQFFLITSHMNLSPVSLLSMKNDFFTWAIADLQAVVADLTKSVSATSFVKTVEEFQRGSAVQGT